MRRKPASSAWDNKYTRPPAWETEEPGIWASILQELPEKPSSLSAQQERLQNWPLRSPSHQTAQKEGTDRRPVQPVRMRPEPGWKW